MRFSHAGRDSLMEIAEKIKRIDSDSDESSGTRALVSAEEPYAGADG
jgi:hypothetical protein